MGSASAAALILAQSAQAQEASPTPVPDISVTVPATAEATTTNGAAQSGEGGVAPEGSEAAGYKPSTVSNFGPFGQTPILDVPYSVDVISAPLMENLQMSKTDDIFKIDPTLQAGITTGRQPSQGGILRGFIISNVGEDGMVLQPSTLIPLEDKERVEILKGLTSFLYGPTNVGGFMNYVYKRPTDAPLANITVGDYGGLSGYVHGDFGGPVKIPGLQDGLFSYRLNIVGQNGDTAVNGQSEKRDVLTAALTWHITENAALTVIGSHIDQNIQGADAYWTMLTNPNGSPRFPYPAAPNPSQNYAQPWTGLDTQRDRIGADLNWKWNDIFTLRASYAYSQLTGRGENYANNTITAPNGTYSQTLIHAGWNLHDYANTGYLFLDANFDTGFIHHKVTTGFYGNDITLAEAPTANTLKTVTNLNYAPPPFISEPIFSTAGYGPLAKLSYNNARNVVLGDEIKFSEQWSALIGANRTDLSSRSFNNAAGANDALTSSYDAGRVTPSASLIFKPVPWLSTYATYSQSLQQGTVVANSAAQIFTNNGSILPPFVGTEYEVGAKADVGGVLLTASLYQITQALQYAVYNNNATYTEVQNGRQRNQGIELVATGNVFEGFRIFGGVTLIDPREFQGKTSATAPAINGLIALGVANQLEKITAEYDLPFVKGLTLTGGFYFTGQQAIDRLDTYYLPSFATEDLGFRYRTSELFGQKLPIGQEAVLRFNVSNITNKAYWQTPNWVGQPRTFLASAQLKF